MKVFYVPFNNRGLGVETYEEQGFMEDLIEAADDTHIEEGEEGVVFIYVSEPDSGFTKIFSKKAWPHWLKGINIVVRKHYDQNEADKMALELADHDHLNVVEFRPYPSGLMDERDIARTIQSQRERWGWGYVAPIEESEPNAV